MRTYTAEEHNRAYQSRLRQLRDLGIPLPAGASIDDDPDPLTDPGGWIEKQKADVAEDQLRELVELQKDTEQPFDLLAESNKWLAEEERKRRH